MSYRSHAILTLLSAMVLLVGCGSDASDHEDAFVTSVVSEADETPDAEAAFADEPSVRSPLVSAASVTVDGITYGISCVAVPPVELSNPLATARYGGAAVSTRALVHTEAHLAIAVEVPGGACSSEDKALSEWSLAFAPDLAEGQAQRIACDSGFQATGC